MSAKTNIRWTDGKAIYKPKGKAGEYSTYACNLYRGCGHQCAYCYVPAMLRMSRDDWNALTPTLRPGILDALAKEAPKLAAAEPGAEVFLCFTSDPYHVGDTRPTREAIHIIGEAGLVPVILTKGGMRAERDFDLMAKHGGKFGQTIVFAQEMKRMLFEPNAAPLLDRRTAAIKARSWWDIWTWVSLEPVISAEDALIIINGLHDVVNHWKVGKINYNYALECGVDWGKFYRDVTALLDGFGADYYIKESLRAYADMLDGAEWRGR